MVPLPPCLSSMLKVGFGGLEQLMVPGCSTAHDHRSLSGDDGSYAEDKFQVFRDCDIQWDFRRQFNVIFKNCNDKTYRCQKDVTHAELKPDLSTVICLESDRTWNLQRPVDAALV